MLTKKVKDAVEIRCPKCEQYALTPKGIEWDVDFDCSGCGFHAEAPGNLEVMEMVNEIAKYCKYCNMVQREHMDQKCLFGPNKYEAYGQVETIIHKAKAPTLRYDGETWTDFFRYGTPIFIERGVPILITLAMLYFLMPSCS